MNKTIVERFWTKVDKRGPDECWEWQAGKFSSGYGSFKFEGKARCSNRLAWLFAVGAIPDGLCVLHRCDNRACCNVAHLWLGTKAENNADRDAKGRHVALSGEAHGQAKLTAEDVHRFKKLHRAGVSYVQIAREHGVHNVTVQRACTGRSWKQLTSCPDC